MSEKIPTTILMEFFIYVKFGIKDDGLQTSAGCGLIYDGKHKAF